MPLFLFFSSDRDEVCWSFSFQVRLRHFLHKLICRVMEDGCYAWCSVQNSMCIFFTSNKRTAMHINIVYIFFLSLKYGLILNVTHSHWSLWYQAKPQVILREIRFVLCVHVATSILWHSDSGFGNWGSKGIINWESH